MIARWTSAWLLATMVFVAMSVAGVRAAAASELLAPSLPSTSTLAVVVEADDGPLARSTVQSVFWHALYDAHGHRAAFLERLDAGAIPAMRPTPATTLLHIDVSWKADSARVERGDGDIYLVGGHYPVVDTTEYVLEGDQLVARYTWHTEGPISVFHVAGDDPDRFISLPEVSLQETAALAVQPLHAPLWTSERDAIRVPVVLAADDDYARFYGSENWKQVAGRAVSRANALLSDAGLELHIVGHETWTSPEGMTDLSDLLEVMAADASGPMSESAGAIRIGFTGQTRLAVAFESEMEDVGRAYLPGRDVLIADQAAHPGHDASWDVAEESVAVAHEVMHALGIPHREDEDMLMSATKRGSIHQLAPATMDLARAAAASRYTHWDALTALTALSQSAEQHLVDREAQIDFISENLAFGVGAPSPGALKPQELSALTNVAVGRYYLDRAEKDPDNAWQLQQGAEAHVKSALEQAPAWSQARQLQSQLKAARQQVRSGAEFATPTLEEIIESISRVDDRPWAGTSTCPTAGVDTPTCD